MGEPAFYHTTKVICLKIVNSNNIILLSSMGTINNFGQTNIFIRCFIYNSDEHTYIVYQTYNISTFIDNHESNARLDWTCRFGLFLRQTSPSMYIYASFVTEIMLSLKLFTPNQFINDRNKIKSFQMKFMYSYLHVLMHCNNFI